MNHEMHYNNYFSRFFVRNCKLLYSRLKFIKAEFLLSLKASEFLRMKKTYFLSVISRFYLFIYVMLSALNVIAACEFFLGRNAPSFTFEVIK